MTTAEPRGAQGRLAMARLAAGRFAAGRSGFGRSGPGLLGLGALGLGVLGLAGCGAPPPVRHPDLRVELPAEFGGAAGQTGGAREAGVSGEAGEAGAPGGVNPVSWWASFDDPQLRAWVGEALQNNYDLAAAAARVEAAAQEAKIAGADIFPQLNASGSASRSQQVFVGLPIGGPGASDVLTSTTNSYGVSLNVSWELDLWGRLRTARSAAGADAEAAYLDYYGAQLSLAAQTLKGAFAAREAKRQFDLAATTAESYGTTVRSVRERYERGLVSSLDLRLALVDQANAQASREATRRAYDRSLRQLEILLGRYPGAAIPVAGDLDFTPAPVPAGLPADLLARRPDLAAAERRYAASSRRVSAAKRDLLPRLSLTGSAGRTSSELSDLTDGDFDVWSLAGNLLQPIFQGGRLRAQVKRAGAAEDGALAEYASAVLSACGEVEAALVAEDALAQEEAAAAVAADQARAAFELAEERYRRGLIDVLLLLDAQRSQASAESRLLQIRRQRLDARVDLHLALGGSFEDPSSIPDPAAGRGPQEAKL